MNPQATWIDAEEKAYNRTLKDSQRQGRVMCADGIVRTVRLGIADTYFSIPGQMHAFGKQIAGFVTRKDEIYMFHASGKHKDIFNPKDTPA